MNLKRFFVYSLLLLVLCNQFVLSQETTIHRVQQGETIISIAAKYGVTKEAIMSLNNKDNPDKIIIGETLIIPDRDGLLNEVNNFQTGNSLNAPTDSPNRGKGFGTPQKINRIIDIRFIVVSIIVFVVAFWVRKRYWNKIIIKNKETVFKVVIALGILLAFLSITGIRKLLLWMMGIAVVGVSSSFLIRKFTDKNQQKGHKIADINELGQLRKKVSEQEQEISRQDAIINQLNQKINKLEKEKKDLFEQNIELGKRLEGINYISKNKDSLNKHIQNESCHANSANGIGGDKLFAETILDGVLLKVKDKINEDSIFELDIQSKDTAVLNILSSAHKRILANSAFIHGCDKQIIGNTNISVTPGKAILREDGRWEVTVKPVVIIR